MLDLSVFNGLPEINVLKEQEITLEKIQGELTADFENKFAELEGLDDFTLAATDERRLILDAIGGEFYLFAQYINLCMRQNFLPYMYGPYLKNWAANLGIFESGKEAASCEVKFSLSAVQPTDTTIPEGTRVSAGDNVFFATTEDLVIAAGGLDGTVSVKCTEEGTLGNNYAIGQLTTIVDPVNYVASATNTTATSGGHDEYTNDELREVILNKPYTFSNAGPVGAYEAKVKEYSSAIADVKCITNNEALVQIYIILQDGVIPSTNYCTNVENYILESRQFPDTDMIKVLPAVAHAYTITATYYIDAENEIEYKARVNKLYQFLEDNGVTIDKQNRNPSRLSRMPGAVRNGKEQRLIGTNIGLSSWAEWERYLLVAGTDMPPFVEYKLSDSPRPVPEELIKGVLRRGHKMLLSGSSKAGKSFLLMELCVALVTGQPWLGFECKKSRVLYINLEIDPESCLDRFDRIFRRTRRIDNYESGRLVVWNLRGKALPLDKLSDILIERMKNQKFDAVVLDPIYKVITGDENNATEMGAFCNQFDKICTETGCSAIYCHHHSKGAQGMKKAMDRASGSGVFARDPDAQLDIIELELSDHIKNFVREGHETGWRLY